MTRLSRERLTEWLEVAESMPPHKEVTQLDFEDFVAVLRMALSSLGTVSEPVAWRLWDNERGWWIYYEECQEGSEPLYTHPSGTVSEERPCTCHPDDNPPVPCPKKYAFSECRKAAEERLSDERIQQLAGGAAFAVAGMSLDAAQAHIAATIREALSESSGGARG